MSGQEEVAANSACRLKADTHAALRQLEGGHTAPAKVLDAALVC